MNLHSGLAYWIIKNELFNYFNPLKNNISIDVAIIGSGITGSLVAHELCKAGISSAVFDKRTIATGSTAASTSQLQYEIDVPLCKMKDMVGEENAVNAYYASLKSITDIENVFKDINSNPDFSRVSSIYLASNKTGFKLLEKEYEIRIKHKLPVLFLDDKKLSKIHQIDAYGALKNNESAQMDCYKAAISILKYHMENSELQLYSHTRINDYKEVKNGYELITEHGYKVKCKYVIIAAGFEAGEFLPKNVMNLSSTYALISQPVEEGQLWPEKCLIWETKEPYFYMRTTVDNRMIIGGEDVAFKDPVKRDSLLRLKTKKLENKFKKTYPKIPFIVDMAWCGTFSSTKDGLPYIGNWPGKDRMFFALGYGGNGITFSMIAAQIIKNKIIGEKDERASIFGFERKSQI